MIDKIIKNPVHLVNPVTVIVIIISSHSSDGGLDHYFANAPSALSRSLRKSHL